MSLFKGSGVALVTPFYNDKIDYESMYRLIDYVIDNGTDMMNRLNVLRSVLSM